MIVGALEVDTNEKPASGEQPNGRSRSSTALPFIAVIPFIVYALVSYHLAVGRLNSQETELRKRDAGMCAVMLTDRWHNLQFDLHNASEGGGARAYLRNPNGKWQVGRIDPSQFSAKHVLVTDRKGRLTASTPNTSRVASAILSSNEMEHVLRGGESAGLVRVGNSLFLAASTPLSVAGESGPRGSLTFATPVDESMIRQITRTSGNGSALYIGGVRGVATSVTASRYLPNRLGEMSGLRNNATEVVVETGQREKTVFACQPLRDWEGKTVATLVTGSSRADTQIGRSQATIQALLLIGSCLLAAFLAAMQMRASKLIRHANVDELTGLYNHRYLQERLGQELQRSKRYRRDLSIIMLDIDHFKRINDSYGHQVGDQALRELSNTIQSGIRQADVVARYGGEEFLVIMPETSLDGAEILAERLRRSVEESVLEAKVTAATGRKSSTEQIRFTVSLGVACFPIDAQRGDELIMAADLALFAAKHASRNAVRTYRSMSEKQTGRRLDPQATHLAMRDGTLAAVQALAGAVDARDPGMRGHSEKVALYSLAIGHAMELSAEDIGVLHKAALLHDVGRIAIPDAIHLKPGNLTEAEMTVVMSHSIKGAEILSKAPQLTQEAKMVRHHHERFDGTGYPDGLAEEDIPLASRIIAAADAFDAMTSHRAYRRASMEEEAMKMMWESSGTQFDPKVLEALNMLVGSGELRALLESFKGQMDLAA